MSEPRVRRRLSAILSADVQGYSRLMENDDEDTIRTLTLYRDIMFERVSRHGGRVVDSPGDNILSRFESVLDAVACGVDVQRELEERNRDMAPHRRMRFRMGINLGDVIEDGERIYGEGVNIAARLEGLADGGGICISGSAYEQVRNRMELGFEYLGEQSVKNIAEPVRAYKVLMGPGDAGKLRYSDRRDAPGHKRRIRLTLLIALCLLIVAGGLLKLAHRTERPNPRLLKQKLLALALPDKPSVAVLPFANMSDDRDQDYFSDGMTDDLITDLSKISGLFVISRNSVFSYKGKNVKIETIARELGVRYVLEGSVRKAGDRVRINAQLIDATTGGHVWADRYDRELRDIFHVQDEVRRKIVSALAIQLTRDDQNRLLSRGTRNLEAYDAYLRGMELLMRKREADLGAARRMLEKAVSLDSGYAEAYAALGLTYLSGWIFGWDEGTMPLEKAREYGRKALDVRNSSADGHIILGYVLLWEKKHDLAIAEMERALALDPNGAEAIAALGEALTWAGRAREAVDPLLKAIRIDPKYPAWYLWNLGHAYFLTGDLKSAVNAFQKALNRNSDFWPPYVYLALCHRALGNEEEAVAAAKAALRLNESMSPQALWEERLPYKNPETTEAVIGGLVAILKDAGVPPPPG